MQPTIGITADLIDRNGRPTAMSALAYSRAVAAAGGLPILLPPVPELAPAMLATCRGVVLSGGDNPRTEPFGPHHDPTHPEAGKSPVPPERQAFETALLRALLRQPEPVPALGVCLGMQMMALVAGGRLEQHLPDTLGDRADAHWAAEHGVLPEGPQRLAWRPSGATVHSHHRQAVRDPGALTVIARAPDGVIEAVADPAHPFYVGVQWHPERTADPAAGASLFEALVRAASR